MKTIINILTIVMGILVAICFIIGIIGVLIEKKNGRSYIGQGFGRK